MSHNIKLPIGSLTPGPWHMSPSTAKLVAGIDTADGACIGTARRDEDARLWAASPDLLAALQWADEWLRDWRSKYKDSTLPAWVRWHDEMVKPAIAKAEGREV